MNPQEFFALCESLDAAVIRPMLSDENCEDTIRDFGTLGFDILQRWSTALKTIEE